MNAAAFYLGLITFFARLDPGRRLVLYLGIGGFRGASLIDTAHRADLISVIWTMTFCNGLRMLVEYRLV